MFGRQIASIVLAAAMMLGLGAAGAATASEGRQSTVAAGGTDFPACC